MNTVLLNTISLDEGRIIKKGSGGGGGGVTIKNQSKSVEFTENGTSEVRYDTGYTGLEKVSINVAIPTEEKTVDITENGTTEVMAANGFLSKVVVNTNVASSGGGSGASAGAVNFRDYDGTILHSFSAEQFLALAELPPLPTQEGLICQEWNWSFEDAKSYVEEYGVLEVGATYITDDGKTRLYITVATEGRKDVPLYFYQSAANGVIIDWGDGSEMQSISTSGNVNILHSYSETGDYIITLSVVDNAALRIGGDTSQGGLFGLTTQMSGHVYRTMLKKMEVGDKTNFSIYALKDCVSLKYISLPNSVVSIPTECFENCFSLKYIAIPSKTTDLSFMAFFSCYSLEYCSISNSVTTMLDQVFQGCASLRWCYIPSKVTELKSSCFQSCTALERAVMPKSASLGQRIFYAASSLKNVIGLTNISNGMFSFCYCLSELYIMEGASSIGVQGLYYCRALSYVKLPKSFKSIGTQAFEGCHGMKVYDFTECESIPTLSSTNAFTNIPSDCKIVVPDALYDSWVAATNWSSYASYIVKASEFNG